MPAASFVGYERHLKNCAVGVLQGKELYCMDKKPIVSVVIPAYNAEKYIAAAIDSVLGQTYSDFEVLVVNDCSTDGTKAMVENFAFHDERVCLINLPANKGAPAGPRNIGVLRARGRWIAFLDADDWHHPHHLQYLLNTHKAWPDADAVATDFILA